MLTFNCIYAIFTKHGFKFPFVFPKTAEQENESIKSPMNDFYFLTDPEEFIYTHLPHEEEWQLLVRPVLRHEFDVSLLIFNW